MKQEDSQQQSLNDDFPSELMAYVESELDKPIKCETTVPQQQQQQMINEEVENDEEEEEEEMEEEEDDVAVEETQMGTSSDSDEIVEATKKHASPGNKKKNVTPRVHVCKICNEEFERKILLKRHLQTDHADEEVNSKEK